MRVILFFLLFVIVIIGCTKEKDCKSYTSENCPKECLVCPPCEVCSSISCQSEEFCESIGFNKTWYEQVRPK